MRVVKPLVIESFRKVVYNNTEYKRRLRISGYNALLIDSKLGTNLYHSGSRFVVLDLDDIEKACDILCIPFKEVNTYFCIDSNLCSFSSVP